MTTIKNWLNKVFSRTNSDKELPEAVRRSIELEYPSNLGFTVRQRQLYPSSSLADRYKKIHRLYPQPLNSLLDLSCSKGYFVFAAAAEKTCERALGIDVYQPDLQVCQILKQYINSHNTQFENLRLMELSNNISNWGSAFQTVLLINSYQYLFFGSDRESEGYLDHDKIFAAIHKICSKRFIFSNRVEVNDCQNQDAVKKAGLIAKNYNREAILDALSRYFTLISETQLGKYPLWKLEAK